MDYANWNRGLLLGGLLIMIAGMALVSGRRARDRALAAGMLVQGIVMLFVAERAFFPRPQLEIAALALGLVACLWCVWSMSDGTGAASTSPAAVPNSDDASPSTSEPSQALP